MRKVAVITGATKNVGYAIAERFVREGYEAVVTSRFGDAAEAAAERLRAIDPQARTLGIQMDPEKVADIRTAFAQIEHVMGRVDVLVCNAANLGFHMNIFNTTEDDWNAVMNVNARGSFFCCQEAVRRMGHGGAVCIISSTHSMQCMPDRIVYAASKGALNVITRAAALESAHKKIRINSVIVGPLWTDRWEQISEEERRNRRDIYPCGRESRPDEIANAVYFLCSDQAATTTGSQMVVDSGVTLSLESAFDKNWRPTEEQK